MSDENNSDLDDFFTSNLLKPEETPKPKDAPKPEETPKNEENSTVDLEDEFAKLLESFINNEPVKEDTEPSSSNVSQSSNDETLSLDDFITAAQETPDNKQDTFVSETSTNKEANTYSSTENKNMFADVSSPEKVNLTDEQIKLKQEELELSRAFFNFKDGIIALSNKKNFKTPTTDFNDSQLYPNYKPSIGKKIAQYLLSSWDILNKYDPENMKNLSPNATDEEYLIFAEQLSDTDMQLVIISYVEILINMEICEVKYEQMKEIALKNRAKRELYEEYVKLQERKAMFIKKLKEQKFPIDVDSLINNYIKASQKDSKGAYEALTKNPAMFSPIQIEKIKPKFFGLIKVVPEDGIKVNKKIGDFIKKLKI